MWNSHCRGSATWVEILHYKKRHLGRQLLDTKGDKKKIVAHTTIKGYKYISSPKTASGATTIFFVALGVIMGDDLLVVAPSSNFGLRKNYRSPNL